MAPINGFSEMRRVIAGTALALAFAWPGDAGATLPASAEQMICLPAVIVIATVAPTSPPVDVPDDCKLDHGFCNIDVSMTIRVDEVLATRPSDLTPEDVASFASGSTLDIKIAGHPNSHYQDIAPEDFQGVLSIPLLSREELASRLRGRKFIFGLGSSKFKLDWTQIWSMDFQKVAEKTLIESRKMWPEGAHAPDCATLNERAQLEKAAAEQPPQAAPLIALAKFHERIEDGKANDIFRKAIALAKDNEALDGFIRTLGMDDMTWAATGLQVAGEVLQRDPSNRTARRLRDQSYIHGGRYELIDTTDLSHGSFETLDLGDRHLPHASLEGTVITRLQASAADLSFARLSDVKMKESVWVHANLEGAQLKDVDLGSAVLTGANFSKTTGLKGILSFNAAGASFASADLRGADIRIEHHGIRFPMVPFSGEDLAVEDNESKPRDEPGPAILFRHANLSKAKIQIDGMQIDLSGADLTGATFDLTDLRGANFSGAKLDGSQFFRTVYDCSTKWPEHFVPSAAELIPLPGPSTCGNQLSLVYDGLMVGGLNFAGLDLRHASFRNARGGISAESPRLVGADLSGTDLSGIQELDNRNLNGANLDRANLRNAHITIHPDLPLPRLNGADLRGAHIDILNYTHQPVEHRLFEALDAASIKGAVFICRQDINPSPARSEYLERGMVPDRESCHYEPSVRIDLSGQDLGDADLSMTDLRGVDFTNANLTHVRLKDALYNGRTRWPEGFDAKGAGARFCESGDWRQCS